MWTDLLDKYLATDAPALREKTRRYNLEAENRGLDISSWFLFPKGINVLDVGCGTGGVAIAFAKSGAHVTAIEPNPILLRIARERAAEAGVTINFVCSHIEQPPRLPPQGMVILNDVLEHVANPEAAMTICHDLLIKHGIMWVSTPNRYSPKQILREGHSGLFGVSLLPPKLAKFYVEKVRRAMPTYSVNKIHSYFDMVKHFTRLGMDYALVGSGNPEQHFEPRNQLRWLFSKPLRPGFFEFVAWRLR